ncbi:MAG: TetR/AcrR family transcriptional regulator [Pseudonocardiaceae bacterium]
MTDQPSAARVRLEQPTWVDVDPRKDYTRPPPLSRPRIVRVALQLVDEKGLAALTMRALATELEVSPMALYNHVRDKDELVDLMVDLMLGEVDCSATEGDWVTQLRTLVHSYHQALAAHHQLARIYSARVRIGPHGLLVINRTIELLLQGGFSPAEAADAFFALYTYAAGFHQMGHIAPLRDTASQDEIGYYSALPAERVPSIQAVRPHLDGVHRAGRFEYGLEIILAGLLARVAR